MQDTDHLIDWTKVLELREDVGPEGFAEVVELFLEEVETALQTIGMAEDLEAALHFVKGCALNIGFASFAHAAASGESLAARGLPDKVDLTGLADTYRASRDLFLRELRSRTAA